MVAQIEISPSPLLSNIISVVHFSIKWSQRRDVAVVSKCVSQEMTRVIYAKTFIRNYNTSALPEQATGWWVNALAWSLTVFSN